MTYINNYIRKIKYNPNIIDGDGQMKSGLKGTESADAV